MQNKTATLASQFLPSMHVYLCFVICRLVIRALLHQSGLFEGSSDTKYLSYDVDMLTDGKHRFAGQLVALSLKYDEPGHQCFHTAVYKAITDQNVSGDSFTVDMYVCVIGV